MPADEVQDPLVRSRDRAMSTHGSQRCTERYGARRDPGDCRRSASMSRGWMAHAVTARTSGAPIRRCRTFDSQSSFRERTAERRAYLRSDRVRTGRAGRRPARVDQYSEQVAAHPTKSSCGPFRIAQSRDPMLSNEHGGIGELRHRQRARLNRR